MQTLKVIAITHQRAELGTIGLLHINEQNQGSVLSAAKINFGFEELMYLSTCNRIEFILKTEVEITESFLHDLFLLFNSNLTTSELEALTKASQITEGLEALEHLLNVASSLDSLVVGEREIITQVRKAYETCNMHGVTGDLIRQVIKQTIETAKDVYTYTDIAKNPVSVVSLAYRKLRDIGIKNDAKFLIIGAGETTSSMCNYLKKHQYANFSIFNRTVSKATKLADSLNGNAYSLSDLAVYKNSFDVIVTCTASNEPIITKEIYEHLLNGDKSRKVIIDLAIPADVDSNVVKSFNVDYIDIESLKKQAEANLALRAGEIEKCKQIIKRKTEEFVGLLKERQVELAFGEIPKQVKAIRETAVNSVFAKEISNLDEESKAVLEKVLLYMEKKYNAVAMKTAKDVLLDEK